MPAPLTIIIPTLNAAKELEPLLPDLVEGSLAGLIAEVIFADGGSRDATATIAKDTGAVFIAAPAGRGTQMHCAAQKARGSWLLFLHADSRLPRDWIRQIETHMNAAPGRAAAFRLAFDSPVLMARITAGWANLRSRFLGMPYGDQGLLISADHYERIGGFEPIPLMEDVAMARKLRGHLTLLPLAITTSAARYERAGWIRRGAHNLLTLAGYLIGRDPEALARRYNRPPP